MPEQYATPSKLQLSGLVWQLWCQLSRRRKIQFGLVSLLTLVSAVAEIVSLGAVVPFLGILVAPEKVFANPHVEKLAHLLGITSADALLLPFAAAFAGAAVAAAGIRMLLLWANTRLAFVTGSDISIEVYRRTLYQPFQVHLSRNSSEVSASLDYKVGYTVGVLLQLLTLVSSVAQLIAVMLALLAFDATVATIAAVGFGSCYALISWLFKRKLAINAERIARESTQVIKAVHEGLGGIRDVLLDGTQPFYCEIYRRADYPLRLAMGNNIFMAGSPRFAMEAIGMVLIVGLAYSLSLQPGGVAAALPLLGALALGAQRLLPSLQQSYSAWAGIAGSRAALAETLAFLEQPLPEGVLDQQPLPLSFKEEIRFDETSFRYGTCGLPVIDKLNLVIPKRKRIGIVGGTGSGKSTLLDLLMGLIEPDQGNVRVDGVSIAGHNRRAWQRVIAHVPQTIYLADTTLAENVAFGVPRSDIDMDRVREAARQAKIADFIESRPEGYEAFVGERGVRLSGGQRQRIGIARALYKQASVLVFDEATSALDNATEQEVMSAIAELDRELTIVIVAHRLTTIKNCDSIVELSNGRVVAQGTYDQLLERSESFRHMALAAD
ncbi:MAG: ABC transporter ATP-binding protein [Rhodocyclaceae bacterium]|nr:ABC transporter ATP-binding protein [Rhodocyclaceae bacterium]